MKQLERKTVRMLIGRKLKRKIGQMLGGELRRIGSST